MSGMSTMQQLYHFVDDLEASLGYDLGVAFDCDSIILCGVGGSAVSGDIAADCCTPESVKPIRLVKYPDLPNWVGPRTLAVVSSYSGNTAETLEMYRQARARGCTAVAMTSGGKLKALAESNGDTVIDLPAGMHPRHAIGYMIGYTLAAIRAAGGPDLSERIRGFIPALREFRDQVSQPDGQARALAGLLGGRVPVVCSESGMRSVPFRWKTQINENSKFVAFCESTPDFCPMASGPWASGTTDGCILTVLMPMVDYDPASRAHLEDVLDRLSDGSEAVIVGLFGESLLENMFRAIILGDYVSIFVAEDRGIDPAEVRPVTQLKAKLAGKGY